MAFLDEYDFNNPDNMNTFNPEGTGGGYASTNENAEPFFDQGGIMTDTYGDRYQKGYSGSPSEEASSFSGGGGGSGSRFNLDDDIKPVAQQAANYGGGGGGGGSSSGYSSSVTYQRPLRDMPTLGDYGAVPAYDEGKVRSLQQEKAATGVSKLRGAVSEAITRSVSMDNPYLRKMLMKDTLSGFGEGMGSVMNTADANARTAYDTEYKGKLTGYQNNINRVNTMFEAAMRDFMARPYDMTSPIGPGISDPMTGKKL
jgi:hypothetical protein